MNVLIVAATKAEITSVKILELPILITGVGMVNASINLTKKLIKNNYDLVFNMGISGSFKDSIKVGDVVEVIEDIFSEIGFEDGKKFSEFTEFNLQTSYVNEARTSLKEAKGITVNTVHGNEFSISEIMNRLNPDIESMEGAAISKVCSEFNIPYMQIRSISNKVEMRNKADWNVGLAIHNLNKEAEKILEIL